MYFSREGSSTIFSENVIGGGGGGGGRLAGNILSSSSSLGPYIMQDLRHFVLSGWVRITQKLQIKAQMNKTNHKTIIYLFDILRQTFKIFILLI